MIDRESGIWTGGDLKPHIPDRRDYSHHKTFSAPPLSELPDEYLLVSSILSQGFKPWCTAASAVSVRESQIGLQFDMEWQYKKEGEVAGFVSPDGYDLRTMMKSGLAGFRTLTTQEPPEKYKEDSYFEISGPYDLYDSLRAAMWLGKDEKLIPIIGTMLYSEWLMAALGVVPKSYSNSRGLHAMKVAGWTRKSRDGKLLPLIDDPYLVCQNSFGEVYGDRGLLYFSREIVNREFHVGGVFCWRTKPTNIKIEKIGTLRIILNELSKVLRDLGRLLNKIVK